MKDKQTETKLRLISLQLESWKNLHELITYGLDKAKPIISVEQERQFTEVRANLLQETEHVLRELNLLSDLSGRAMNVLNRGSSLRAVRELSNDEARRLEGALWWRSATRRAWSSARFSMSSSARWITLRIALLIMWRWSCEISESFNHA